MEAPTIVKGVRPILDHGQHCPPPITGNVQLDPILYRDLLLRDVLRPVKVEIIEVVAIGEVQGVQRGITVIIVAEDPVGRKVIPREGEMGDDNVGGGQ